METKNWIRFHHNGVQILILATKWHFMALTATWNILTSLPWFLCLHCYDLECATSYLKVPKRLCFIFDNLIFHVIDPLLKVALKKIILSLSQKRLLTLLQTLWKVWCLLNEVVDFVGEPVVKSNFLPCKLESCPNYFLCVMSSSQWVNAKGVTFFICLPWPLFVTSPVSGWNFFTLANIKVGNFNGMSNLKRIISRFLLLGELSASMVNVWTFK